MSAPEVNPAPTLAAELRRLADLLDSHELEPPTQGIRLTWYLHGDLEQQHLAAADIARALGGVWRADPNRGGTSRYLGAVTTLIPGAYPTMPTLEAGVNIDQGEPERVTVPPDEQLARDLTAAAAIAPDPGAGCSCGASFAPDELDDHLAVCPLPEGDR